MWGLVLAYVMFMMTLASYEATARSRYYFQDMFWYVLAMLVANVTVVSLFAFGLVLNLHPLWDPQYVIPMMGMLLGNCINGVSLSMNSLLSGVVESSREIELLLSFGATTNEASRRNVKEAIRTGSLPGLNGYEWIC
jgi:putative ABC transport system permease protein